MWLSGTSAHAIAAASACIEDGQGCNLRKTSGLDTLTASLWNFANWRNVVAQMQSLAVPL